MISELHRTARALASKGIPVFPCQENAKAPATDHGFKDASTDLVVIDAWWENNPNLNIGICPDAAGCAVVDVDDPAAVAALELLTGEPLPETFTVKTPRGGFHFWYKGRLPSSAGRLTKHVDTRGVGGYVLYPPSVVSGNRYTVVDQKPFADLPDRITLLATKERHVEAATAKSGVELDLPSSIERARGTAAHWPQAEWGTIDDTTYLHCAELADLGLTEETICEIICEWYDRTGTDGNRERLLVVAHSATVNRENALGVWNVAPPQELFADLVRRLPTETEQIEPSRFRVLSEDDQDTIPEPTWLIENVIPANSTVMLFAPSQGWKTFLALDWALTVAAGLDKWGAVNRGTAVYIAAEGAIGIAKSRRPAWRMLHGIIEPLPFYVIPTMPWLSRSDDVMAMCDEILATAGKPKLLVIDTLARAMVGLDENSAKDSSLAIEACEAIKRKLGCTVLVLHHTRKDGNGYRGSGALLAGFDSVIEFDADKDTMTGNVWIKKHKDAEVQEFPYRVKAEALLGSLALRMATEEDAPVQDRLRPGDIGEALRGMSAIGDDRAVVENVLVFELHQRKQWDMKKAARLFRALAKSGRLSAYRTQAGLYCLPAVDPSTVEFE